MNRDQQSHTQGHSTTSHIPTSEHGELIPEISFCISPLCISIPFTEYLQLLQLWTPPQYWLIEEVKTWFTTCVCREHSFFQINFHLFQYLFFQNTSAVIYWTPKTGGVYMYVGSKWVSNQTMIMREARLMIHNNPSHVRSSANQESGERPYVVATACEADFGG